MANILYIETSNSLCSVGITINGKVAALQENNDGNQHATLLTPFIEAALKHAGITMQQLDAVSLSAGPGSYTGLRIGASAAKAICYATGKPLIAVNTLKAMVAGYIKQHGAPKPNTIFCPMIDARRMEVYAALYDENLNELKETQPWILTDGGFFTEYLETHNVICLGNGAGKAAEILAHHSVAVETGIYLGANNLIDISVKKFEIGEFDNAAYFEPIYLKTTPIKAV